MTEAEQLAAEEAFIRFQEENPDWWGDKEDSFADLNPNYVFDLDRLRENLKLTVAQRIERNDLRLWAFLEAKYNSQKK